MRRSLWYLRSFVLAVIVALGAVGAVGTAVAQSNPRALTRDAVREFDRGNYAEARALFLQAHERQPSARLLRGAGMASFELREYVVAHRQLREALAETRRALTSRQRREAEDLLARTDAFLGRFRLRVEPEGAEVTIDLRAPELEEDGTLLLAVGDHTIGVRAEGFVPVDRRFAVRGGENEELTVALERDEPPNADALVAPRPPPPPPPREESGFDRLGVGLVSTGGALLIAAVVDVLWWVDRRNEVDRCEEAETTPGASCLNLGTLRRQSRAAGATTFLVGLAGLAMATVGILRLTWDDDEEDEVACGLGGCTYRLRF